MMIAMVLIKQFTEVNPDKGTETCKFQEFGKNINFRPFTEVNPDKGTETINLLY